MLEVGLGGRLDATNAVASRGVAITAVDLDHQVHLGDTIEAIAAEKAGVIKEGGLTVLGENPAPVRGVIQDVAAARRARLVYAPDDVTASAEMVHGRLCASVRTPRGAYPALWLGLRGRHQLQNAVTAIRFLEELSASRIFAVEPDAIRTAVEDVQWPGRLELARWRDTRVLIDGAHNPAGARALAEYLREAFGRPLPCIVGVMRDKHVEAVLSALAPVASHFVCTAAQSPRATPPATLADIAAHVAPGVRVLRADDARAALDLARRLGAPIVAAGSLYLAGEIRAEVS